MSELKMDPGEAFKILMGIAEEVYDGMSLDEFPKHIKDQEEFILDLCIIVTEQLTKDVHSFWRTFDMDDKVSNLPNLPVSHSTPPLDPCHPEHVHFNGNQLLCRMLKLKQKMLMEKTKAVVSEIGQVKQDLASSGNQIGDNMTELNDLIQKLANL